MSLETELETEIKRPLQEGIGLARAGDKLAAAQIFGRVLKVNPDYEDALVWKAAVCDNPSEAVGCLQRALKLNPQNRRAQAGLEWALKQDASSKFQVSSSKFQGENSGLEVENVPFGSPPAQPELRNLKSETIPGLQPSELGTWNLKPETRNLKSAPFELKLKSKDETKSEPPPYKKSRLANHAPDLVLPPEALPQKIPLSQIKAKSRFSLRQPSSRNGKLEQAVKKAASPKIALTVAQNVILGEQSGYPYQQKTDGLTAIWPLGLFAVALALALLTFLFSSFAPLLGVIALVIAAVGIILFDRAEF